MNRGNKLEIRCMVIPHHIFVDL